MFGRLIHSRLFSAPKNKLLTPSIPHSQGASIAVAVSDLFPQLISGKVALIASAGLLEVRPSPPPSFTFIDADGLVLI